MKNTSWGNVADWYHDLLESGEGTYQKELILPNLKRLLGPIAGKTILDAACGPGYFLREWHKAGANVIGVDISAELIALAREAINNPSPSASAKASADRLRGGRDKGGLPAEVPPIVTKAGVAFESRGQSRTNNPPYVPPTRGESVSLYVCNAEEMPMIQTGSVDIAAIILAVQNIERAHLVFAECARVLKPNGRLLIVMNHPAFRVPQASSWSWDNDAQTQYRRVDAYLSEAKVKIEMHPGKRKSESTITFHRPLQVYVKHLSKAGFGISRLEEWISNRQGPKGKRFAASEKARKEIPLFLFLEARKI